MKIYNDRIKWNEIISDKFILFVGILCSIISLIFLLFADISPNKSYIVLLPIVAGIGSVYLSYKKFIVNIGSMLLYAMYIFRYTLMPIALAMGQFHTDISPDLYENSFNLACGLMSIEFLIVSIAMGFFCKKYKKKMQKVDNVNLGSIYKIYGLDIIAMCFIGICAMLMLIFPQFKWYFKIAFVSDALESYNNYLALVESVPGIIFYPFDTMMNFLKIYVPMRLANMIISGKMSEIKKILLIGLIVIVNFLIMTQSQILTLLVSIVILANLVVNIVKYQKKLIYIVAIGGIFVVLFYIVNIANVAEIKMLSRMFNNYFNGPVSIAAAIEMRSAIPPTSELFINDIISNIRYLQLISDIKVINSNHIFNNFIGNVNMTSIFPMLGQGYYYYGIVFAFLPSVIMVGLTYIFDYLTIKNRRNAYNVMFAFGAITYAISGGMYSCNICVSYMFDTLLMPIVMYWATCIYMRLKHGSSKLTIYSEE